MKELEIGKGGLQGMVYSFHKLKGPPTRWWMMVTTCSVKTAGSPCRLQGCRDEDVYVADLHLEKHMSESAWWCFLPSGVPMGSHMSVVTCMKVCVLADSGSGLPMLKVKMDYPNMSSQMELCLELRPADFGTSNRGACSEDVVGLGWSDQSFQIASLLPNEWVRPCVSVLVPQKWSLQVLKTRL